MKMLKSLFENKETNKSIKSFTETLDIESMLLIKGGEGDDTGDDDWPPVDNNINTTN